MAHKFKREFKNVVYNYTDAETKVREATSNDPWGPSSAIMSEMADYTYHVQAYSLVMGMLWKRLNDHGKNWRHVYKSLVVLEYLMKAGSERVAQQCKDNIFSIQTLKDFQYVDKDGKDQGANVREKAKQLVALLKDDKKLKEERVRAHQARERQEGVGSSDSPRVRSERRVQFSDAPSAPDETPAGKKVEQNVEQARPTDPNEEELQLRLAIQLSKQHAEEEEKVRNQEEESLKAAIALSQVDSKEEKETEEEEEEEGGGGDLLLDLNSSGLHDPWAAKIAEPPPSYDDVTTGLNDPWSSFPTAATVPTNQDPFAPISTGQPPVQLTSDPWAPVINSTNSVPPQPTAQLQAPPPAASLNPFDLSGLGIGLPPFQVSPNSSPLPDRVEDRFLGTNSNLVDLDLLGGPPVAKTSGRSSPSNPFGAPTSQLKGSNPFDANKPLAPTLNQLVYANQGYPSGDLLPPPLIPVAGQTSSALPFLPEPAQPYSHSNQPLNPFS